MIKHVLLVLVVMLLLPLGAAQARPRDDAMARLYHCNGLESDRQWLDCYYGAAQPARAALGLKPALPAQISLAQSLTVGSPARPSDARSRVVVSAGACYGEPGDRDWLDCYYRAARPMREQLGLAVPAPTPVAPPTRPDMFGASLPSDGAAAKQIVSRMTAYNFSQHMIFTVILANGQSWRQIEGDTDAARWKKSPAAYLVTIRPGFSGSFILTVRGEPHSFRVRRIS
jgi:hypothetical protein